MLAYPQGRICAMRDIREDLKERVASITAELDELKKREKLLASIQQSLFGLLEEEDRRFRDRVSPLIESTPKGLYSESIPKGLYSESTPNGLYGTEHPKANSTELPKTVKVSLGSWASDLRKAEG
jgi:hypothetical protein